MYLSGVVLVIVIIVVLLIIFIVLVLLAVRVSQIRRYFRYLRTKHLDEDKLYNVSKGRRSNYYGRSKYSKKIGSYSPAENSNSNSKRTTNPRIVITMTTTPKRIRYLRPTIASLLDQTIHVDEIALNIPHVSRKGLEYKIPKWLSRLKHVKIHRVDKDEGPGTKLFATLRRESPTTRIIVVDDDVIYNTRMVETLLNKYESHDGKCAVSNFGFVLQKDGTIQSLKSMAKTYVFARQVDLLQGFSGYLVTPDMFPKEVFDLDQAPPEALTVDDVWWSCWLRYNKVKILTPSFFATHLSIPVHDEKVKKSALSKTTNGMFSNDKIVINWFMANKGFRPLCLD